MLYSVKHMNIVSDCVVKCLIVGQINIHKQSEVTEKRNSYVCTDMFCSQIHILHLMYLCYCWNPVSPSLLLIHFVHNCVDLTWLTLQGHLRSKVTAARSTKCPWSKKQRWDLNAFWFVWWMLGPSRTISDPQSAVWDSGYLLPRPDPDLCVCGDRIDW